MRVTHLRDAGLCLRGARVWFRANGLDFAQFLAVGLPLSQVERIGDPLAQKVAAAARDDAEGR